MLVMRLMYIKFKEFFATSAYMNKMKIFYLEIIDISNFGFCGPADKPNSNDNSMIQFSRDHSKIFPNDIMPAMRYLFVKFADH